MLEWSAEYLTQPDGPNAGEPWEYTREQVRIILNWYEIDAQGRFVHRRGVIRRMKGWGKDPFLASLSVVELCGPCRFGGWDSRKQPVVIQHPAPWIQVAAVSRDQTRNTMTVFPGLISRTAIDEYQIDPGKEIIYARGVGRIEAVTSSPRSLEGGRASLVIANETQHWLDNNDGTAMGAVIKRNLAKSRDASGRVMEITNAHLPGEGSFAEETYEAVRATNGHLPGVFYDSVEAPPIKSLGDTNAVRRGLLAARGDSVWLDVDRLAEEVADPTTPEWLSRRFYLNQVVAAGVERWLPPETWARCADLERVIPDRARVVLGFDGSDNMDATALVAVSIEDRPHVHLVQLWERAPDALEWHAPRIEIMEAIRAACRRWKVVEIACDPYIWVSDLEALADEGLPVVRHDQRSVMMIAATQRTTELVTAGGLTHDGDPDLARHVANAVPKRDARGIRLTKDAKGSARRIDAAIATVMAVHRAAEIGTKPAPRYIDLNEVYREMQEAGET